MFGSLMGQLPSHKNLLYTERLSNMLFTAFLDSVRPITREKKISLTGKKIHGNMLIAHIIAMCHSYLSPLIRKFT